MQYGKKLYILRTVAGYTQNQMAEKLHITASAYGKLKREESMLTTDRAKQVCRIFKCDINWLMSEEIFSMLIQSDGNGNLTMNIMNADTALNTPAQQTDQQILLALVKNQEKRITRLIKALEISAQINNNHTKKNQRPVRKRKSRKPRVVARQATLRRHSSYLK